MKVGLYLNSQGDPDEPLERLVDGLISQVTTADDAGFDTVSMGQHYLNEYPQIQLIPMLSRLTAVSDSMTVATGVILSPLHPPVEIAEQVTTLSALAEGVAVGVGLGYRDEEFANFGVPKSERTPRLVESVEIMNRLWTQSDVSYDGTYYSVENATINPRPSTKPPVWIAATTPKTVERAARLGDRWLANPIAPRSELARLKTHYDAKRAGHEATPIPLIREAFVAPTTQEAFETVRPYLEPRFQKYFEWDDQNGSSGDGASNFRILADERFLVGTPAEVCEKIDRYDEEVGLSHLLLRVHWPGLSYEKSARCIELLGGEVLPHV